MILNDNMIRKALGSDATQEFLWDSELPGFGVRIQKLKKVFVVRYYREKKRHIESIGTFGILSTNQARDIARHKLMIAFGFSPAVEYQKRFADVAMEYIDIVSSQTKKSWKKDLSWLKARILPVFGTRNVKDILKRDIDVWHKSIKAHYAANRCLALMSTIFNQAIDWEYCEENPCRRVRRHRERPRDKYVERKDYPYFKMIVEKEREPYPSIIKLIIMTGLRKDEALSLKWEYVDMEAGILSIPETKNGTRHTIPLSTGVMEILSKLEKNGEYVFQLGGKRLKDFQKPWYRIRKEFGDEKLQVRDLRRTFGSWLAQDNVSLHQVGALLNHKTPKTTMIYARFQKEDLRSVVEKIK